MSILNTPMKGKVAGKPVQAPAFKVMARQICRKALGGDKPSLRLVFDFALMEEAVDQEARDKKAAEVERGLQRLFRNYPDMAINAAEMRRVWMGDLTPAERRQDDLDRRQALANIKARRKAERARKPAQAAAEDDGALV